jgi:hypothetical protein
VIGGRAGRRDWCFWVGIDRRLGLVLPGRHRHTYVLVVEIQID